MQQTILIGFMFLILLSGCTPQSDENEVEHDDESSITKLSTDQAAKKSKSTHIKDTISTFEEITSVHSIDAEKKMVVAFEVKHRYRLKLESLRTNVQKKIEQIYSDLDVTVSTDQKILKELEKLEKNKKNLSQIELKKQLERIIKMDKDET